VQELLKPFLLACESKNAKLASIALVSFQKLLANDAVSEEGVPLIIAGLEQVDHMQILQPGFDAVVALLWTCEHKRHCCAAG
jgi:Dimerisation and cyclophilin-binding domain of Mon2